MSLISDALKEVQQLRIKKLEKDKNLSTLTLLSPLESRKKGGLFRLRYMLIIGFIGVSILAFLFVLYPKIKMVQRLSRIQLISRPPVSETAIPEVKPTSPEKDLKEEVKTVLEFKPSSEKEAVPPPKRSKKPVVERKIAALPEMKKEVPPVLPPEAKDKGVPPKSESKDLPIKFETEKTVYHFNLGISYQVEGELERAKREYEKVLNIDPLYVEAYNNLGSIYKEWGRLDEAITLYEKAVSINPKYAKAHHNLGVVFYLQGKFDLAAAKAKLALAYNPKSVESYNILGSSYRRQNRFSEAEEILRKALEIDPHDPQTHYNLALMIEDQKRLPEAIFYYKNFVELSGNKNQSLTDKVKRHIKRLESP